MLGFALMKMPRRLNAAYERSPMAQQNRNEVQRLRDAFKGVDPASYRGFPVREPEAASDTMCRQSARDTRPRSRLDEFFHRQARGFLLCLFLARPARLAEDVVADHDRDLKLLAMIGPVGADETVFGQR